MEKTFCQGCKQKVNVASGISGLVSKSGVVEFEDGYYCEKCAKVKVEKHRKKK